MSAALDDEVDITSLFADYLQGRGYRVTELHRGRDLLALLASDPPAAVLLDRGLPGEDGLVIARQLRERSRCGLIIVTGRGDAVDKVVGLEIGADDYVTKPFDLRELLARITAILRRTGSEEPARPAAPMEAAAPEAKQRHCFVFAGFAFDIAARSLTDAHRQDIAPTAGEFDLLEVFVEVRPEEQRTSPRTHRDGSGHPAHRGAAVAPAARPPGLTGPVASRHCCFGTRGSGTPSRD